MANVTVLNTTNQLSGKTIILAESDQTITGLHTFNRGASAPFAVPSGAAVVSNLDADKVDGIEGGSFVRSDAADTLTGNLTLNDNVKHIYGTGGDAEVYYDGTDLILNTQAVGTGALSLTKGQIKFPGTQNASSDANTLDDYEEGSWTPTYGGFSGSVTTNFARYVKVGSLVTIWMDFVGTSNATTLTFTVPFVFRTGTNFSALWVGLRIDNSVNSATPFQLDWVGGSATVSAFTVLGGTGWTGSNNKGLRLNLSYFTD